MTDNLSHRILSALAYFDVFGYPLTPSEVWKWLPAEEERDKGQGVREETAVELSAVITTLDQLVAAGRVETDRGFYFFPGKGEMVTARLVAYRDAEAKFRRARRVASVLRTLPFIRFVGVANSLAFSYARPQSDIDFFIVAKSGHVWTARLAATGLAKLLGWRPAPGKNRDTICLSFYLADDRVNLEPLKIGPADDYLAHWVNQVVPLADSAGIADRLFQENQWTATLFPNRMPYDTATARRVRPSAWAPAVQRTLELLLGAQWIERQAERWQRRVLPDQLRRLAEASGSEVVLDAGTIKLHGNDRRQQFQAAYEERLRHVHT